ncbi:MAG: polyketide cyclase [Pseudonocardiales bacterium]|nr:polyketide cyclase [Pseudonocardiales bacterium]
MIEVKWTSSATRVQLWDVLSDGWLYAGWVVGASRIREVDSNWPHPGSKIHHSVGAWPILLNDETQAVESVPDRKLVIIARGRPFGEAQVEVELSDVGGQVEIAMREDVISGPGKIIPPAIRQRLLIPRNTESLRRLALIAEGRSR